MVVEANPEMVDIIRQVHARNGVNPQVRSGAVARVSGPMEFHLARDFWSSSTVDRTSSGSGRKIEVSAFALNDLMNEFQPTFVVCDIEGGEFDLFQESELPGVRALIVEVHSSSLLSDEVKALFERFMKIGFRPRPHSGEPHVWFLER
jgi:FkbM family methyltransferase